MTEVIERRELNGLRCMLGMLGVDVHNKGIRTLGGLLRDRGAEIVYVGEHNSAAGMAAAAADEDVDVIGLSYSTTTYLAHTPALLEQLTEQGIGDVPVMVGGLIHADDEPALREMGVAGVFGPGADLEEIVAFLCRVRDGHDDGSAAAAGPGPPAEGELETAPVTGSGSGDVADESIRLSRTRSWGGLEVEASYGPEEPDEKYRSTLGDPGEYPYARGSYPKMYRSRMWTLRNIVGYGTPADTRDGLRIAREAGSPGYDIVLDTLSQEAIDPDHPSFRADVGMEGCSIGCVADLEALLDGIDITETDIAWHSTVLLYPMLVAMAQRQGIDVSKVQGSHMPDHMQLNLTGYGERVMPARLARRATVDILEYVSANSPKWACGFPQAYNLRERGLTPVQEIAVGMAIVNQAFGDLAERGVSADQVAPTLAWVSTADIDLFEEVAKYRALRRTWARTLKERFGAVDPRSLRLRIACHTSGRALTYQQPLNNLARATVQSLAAILGGVQSLEACTWDEPISIPTHEARELATRTQQILAHEAGVARTADPLGGSWYIESLTDRIESEALSLLAQIEERGLDSAVESGWLEGLMDEVNAGREDEMAAGERILVGVNAFARDDEPAPGRFSFDTSATQEHVDAFIQRKEQRDHRLLRDRLLALRARAEAGENCVQEMVDAFVVDATMSEVWGTFRQALGFSYDPFNVVRSPLDVPEGAQP